MKAFALIILAEIAYFFGVNALDMGMSTMTAGWASIVFVFTPLVFIPLIIFLGKTPQTDSLGSNNSGQAMENNNFDYEKIKNLGKKATQLKKTDINSAIDCLKKMNALMLKGTTPDYPEKLFERLPKFLILAGKNKEAEVAFEVIREMRVKKGSDQFAKQIRRAQVNIKSHPYFLLYKGPTEHKCPVHGKNEGLLLPVDDDYWLDYPMRTIYECSCSVRQVSKSEYIRLKEKGNLKETPV